MESASQPRPFGMVVEHPSDTAFLSEDPRKILEKGEYNKVPIIFGYNSMEGFLSYYIDVLQGKTERSFSMETSIPYDFGFLPGSPEIGEAVSQLKLAYKNNHPYEVSFYFRVYHKLTNFHRNSLTHGFWLEYPKL